MHDWNKKYKNKSQIWGSQLSELAVLINNFLTTNYSDKNISILDIGCGYGRDALYLASHGNCSITGIDISTEAISIAKNNSKGIPNIQFTHEDYHNIDKQYDIIMVANVYHLLNPSEQEKFRIKIFKLLKSGAVLFINTLSVNDKEEFGKGEAVFNEDNSFVQNKYLHFSSIEEVKNDFSSLDVVEIFEKEYIEIGKENNHHHISIFFVATVK